MSSLWPAFLLGIAVGLLEYGLAERYKPEFVLPAAWGSVRCPLFYSDSPCFIPELFMCWRSF